MEIKCGACKKKIDFTDFNIKKSKTMKTIICPHCSRTIIVEMNNKKYYNE